MTKRLLLAAAFAMATTFACCASHSVSLSVQNPKKSEDRGRDPIRSYSGIVYSHNVETKVTSWHYSGKVGCVTAKNKGDTAKIQIEAYFVTREISKGATVEKIAGEMVVGTFEFGDGMPRTQAFEFDSPEVEETKSTVSDSYIGYKKSDRSGMKYLGVIIRAVEDGKVLKVVSMPSNQKWNKAGREPEFSLDGNKSSKKSNFGRVSSGGRSGVEEELPSHRSRSSGSSRGGDEPLVFTRLEGTGESTPPGWMDDFYAAQTAAKNEGKWLLVVFSGSDWCGWCKVLADKVLKTARFQKALKDRYVLVYVDSPHDKALLSEKCRSQNKEVKQMLGAGGGVPEVMIVTAEGRKLKSLGGARHTDNGAAGYLDFFEKVDAALRKLQKAKDTFTGATRKSPEYLKAMHETFMGIDEGTLIECFADEVESLLRDDRSYEDKYPYFKYVKPLEREVSSISVALENDARKSIREDGVEYSWQELRKRQKQLLEGEFAKRYGGVLDKINAVEKMLPQGAALERAKHLRTQVFGYLNSLD